VVAVALALVGPLVAQRETEPEDERGRLSALEIQKEAKYREIRDAEMDFRSGKLSEDDYRSLDRALRREAIAILREIDELRGGSF
jgi:hypothetical protein